MSRAVEAARRRLGAVAVDAAFRGMAWAGRFHPRAQPERHRVEVLRDIAYTDTGRQEHLLDVYRPRDRRGPFPVVLYVHGGGFRILSKDTHYVMALAFARRGFLVCNINYRLSATARFPAALADVATAYAWVVEHAAAFGGDPATLVLAGESAGANLVTAACVAACYERPEAYARRIWATGVVPRAALPACGLLQVTDTNRLARRRPLPTFVVDRLREVERAYLGTVVPPGAGGFELADPLVILEGTRPPDRPLPPFFAAVGTADPLLDDTRRLAAALDRLGAPCEARYYPGEGHAFHALVFRAQARRCWADTFAFLEHHLRS